jgi:integrase
MRLSELRGLTWDNVDLDNKVIHVRQRADEKCCLGPPKSEAGSRDIPMGDFLTNTLKEWKLLCPRRKRGEDDPGELWLVFPTGKGTVQNGGNLYRRVFMPAWIAAGVTTKHGKKAKYNIHALRHAYASRLLGEKDRGGMEISPKRAQALLGHSSFQMTMDTYGHLLPAREDESAEFTAAELALVS